MKRLALSLFLLFSAFAYSQEKILYSFQGGTDGLSPDGSLVSDQAGNLYGTTFYGGDQKCSCGTAFELSPNGQGGWIETVLYRFTGQSDGETPLGGLVIDSQGNLFGTTLGNPYGNSCSTSPCGNVFELSPGGGAWTFAVLHTFEGKKDGGFVLGGVTMGRNGDLFGTTTSGGAKGHGTVFKLSSSGTGWKLKTLHSFDQGAGGGEPAGTLVLDADGTIYGTTRLGGAFGEGVFYRLSPNAKEVWQEKPLYSFKGGKDGAQVTGLASDQSGNLYGVSDAGNGNVFRFAESHRGDWTKKTIHRFGPLNSGNASEPQGDVYINQDRTVYGLAAGGRLREGSLYELVQSNGKYKEIQLYSFQGGDDGSAPVGPPIMDKAGNLYGVTLMGGGTGCGNTGCGTVFEFTP